MALDPTIILQAGRFDRPDVGQTLALREQIMARREATAIAAQERAQAQAKMQRLGAIGAKAAGGDMAGATADALGAGDFDVVTHLRTMDSETRKLAGAKAQAGAAVLFGAGKRPPAERAQFVDAAAPRLMEQGYTDADIAKLKGDLTDVGIAGNVTAAMTLAQQIEQAENALNRDVRRDEARATREFQRGNAYISAGLMPPEGGGTGGTPAMGTGGGAVTGRTQYGWTPRASAGGDNSDAAVDGKISGMAKALGVNPDAPLGDLSPMQIAQALTLSEGGKGSIADRNNNPGNLTDPKTGKFRRFPTKQAGLEAAAAQVRRNLARGQTTIRSMVEGLPVNGGTGAPTGLRAIPGGKLDKPQPSRMTPEEVTAEGLDPNMVYYRGADGVPSAVSGQTKPNANLKPPPTKALTDYQGNSASLKSVKDALWLLDPANAKDPRVKAARGAIGPGTGALGDTFTQINDPKGNDFRAMLGRIGGIIIKDTSGAAVSASEDARLAKWVPMPTDTPEAARAKLRNLQNEIENMQGAFADIYNEENGYRPMRTPGTLKAPTGAKAWPNAPAVGTVKDGYRYTGGNPALPASWKKK